MIYLDGEGYLHDNDWNGQCLHCLSEDIGLVETFNFSTHIEELWYCFTCNDEFKVDNLIIRVKKNSLVNTM
jgi:hypothetical protein